MAQGNVELVREAFAVTDVAAAFEWWHPEIEWVIAREHPEARTLKGRGGGQGIFSRLGRCSG
jgi:ketosteroid isomerase-like protein